MRTASGRRGSAVRGRTEEGGMGAGAVDDARVDRVRGRDRGGREPGGSAGGSAPNGLAYFHTSVRPCKAICHYADKDVAAALPDTIETCVWGNEARQVRCF